jgi:hypothetical protein
MRLEVSNSPHDFGKHIPFVERPFVFASDRKRLAGRSARQQMDLSFDVAKIYFPHIARKKPPPLEEVKTAPLILADSLTAILVALDD